MQQMAMNWMAFGLSLAGLFFFCILYSLLVRWMSKRNVEGQTAWAVVVGVTVTLLAMLPTLGLYTVSIMFCYFTAAGIPMIVEYILRVHAEQTKDKENAKGLAKDLLK